MRRVLLVVSLALLLGVALAPPAGAQANLDPTTLHYVCTGTTVCSGATTLITGSTLPTFNITVQGNTGLPSQAPGAATAPATLYVILLVPSSAPALTFSINGIAAVAISGTFTTGKLFDPLPAFLAGVLSNTSVPDFGAFQSASGQSGTTPSGFTVYIVSFNVNVPGSNAGSHWNASGTPVLLSVTSGGYSGVSGFPVGTVFYAAMSSGFNGNANSSSTTIINTTPLSGAITIVPEPATMALLGTGLLAIGGVARRRMKK